MIRFAIKSALAIGLLATVLPFGQGDRADGSSVDLLGLAVGVQEAVSDLGGFCERAPQACSAARDVAAYTGERIEDGFRIGYEYLNERTKVAPQAPDEDVPIVVGLTSPTPDPLTTGAVESFPLPRPYLAPKPVVSNVAANDTLVAPSVIDGVAIPTPAPRG